MYGWYFKFRNVLQLSEFADVWLFTESVNVNTFIPVLNRRLQDMYISECRFSVQICSSLTLCRELKCTFDRADYLQVLENRNIINVIAKLRRLSHNCSLRLGDIDRYREKADKNENAFYVILMT